MFRQRLDFPQQPFDDSGFEGRREDNFAILKSGASPQVRRQQIRRTGVTGEQPVQFDIEDKTWRGLLAPALYDSSIRNRIEAGVDFDQVEMLGIPAQAGRGRQLFWIPIGNESWISPTGGADANFTSHDENYLK